MMLISRGDVVQLFVSRVYGVGCGLVSQSVVIERWWVKVLR